MAWIKVEQSIRDHRKILQVADELDVDAAHVTGCLVLLWLWAIDNAPEGSLEGVQPGTIARAAQWTGEKSAFIEALTRAGLLDETPDGLQIHDWAERAGNLIERRKGDAERKRRERASKKSRDESAGAGEGQPKDIRTQSRVEQSRVEQTRADQSREDPSPIAPSGGDTVEPAAPSLQEKRFAEFWDEYPKKVGKADALKAWKRAKITEEIFERILQAVRAAKASEQWRRENGRFIPNPATWINQGRWDDELPPSSGTADSGKPEGTLDKLRRMYAEEG